MGQLTFMDYGGLDKGVFMKLYLAGFSTSLMKHEWQAICAMTDVGKLCVLESFFYIHKNYETAELIPSFKDFIMDSGAFTFMKGKSKRAKGLNLEQFVNDYAFFVKKWNIKNFLELDIDHVVGQEKYNDCMKKLQDITGLDPIPVMHRHRGPDWLAETLKKHKRICIGGLVSRDRDRILPYVRWVVNQAHKAGVQVHGLGVSDTKLIRDIPFDSGDSTAWTTGIRFGVFPYFDGHDIRIKKDIDVRIKRLETLLYSVNEWIRYCHYVEDL